MFPLFIKVNRLEQIWGRLVFASVAILLLVMGGALFFGAVPLPLSTLVNFFHGERDWQSATILIELRVPRVLLAALTGAILASCGAVSQGLFRNPLADPSLIGVTAGASAGASCVIVLSGSLNPDLLGLSLVSLGAFVGGLLAAACVFRLATGASGTSVATMLLAGIAISFLAGSLSGVFEFIADNMMLRRISLWRMGGFDAANYQQVVILLCVAIALFAIFPRYYLALNALLLGESEARHLGIDSDKLKTVLVVMIAAGVGSCVAFAGSIAFIGLVVPHMLRMLVGANHRYLIPLCALCGAAFLVLADAFARSVMAPAEWPVGLVTAFIGAPIFISLLRKRHHYGMQ